MKNIVRSEALTYSVYAGYIKALKERFKDLKVTTCGKSVLGREIYAFVMGEGDKNILYVGGTHGLEWLTSLLLLKFTESLMQENENNGTIAGFDVRELLKNRKLIIIPELNPDGIEIAVRGAFGCKDLPEEVKDICKNNHDNWSANARGVDINHNFNADWYTLREAEKKAGINGPSPGRYGGPFPESEPETLAMTRLLRGISVELLISFHSQGEEIYYEYGENTPEKSLHIAKMLAALSDYTLVKNEGLASSGGLKDWFIEEFRKPGFTVEIGKGKNPLPVESLDEIYRRLEAMMVAGMMV